MHGLGRTWFTAVGFMVGSALFALGAALDGATSVDPAVPAWTYFTGSIFFTTAGLLQFLTSRDDELDADRAAGRTRRFWQARTQDWVASAVQLVGTVLFNVNTFRAATVDVDSVQEANQLVWAPDAYGSVAFLVSSALAFAPEVRRRRHRHRRDRSWGMGALNLLGSVFFGLSALGAYTLPESGSLVNERWANLGTFLGAVCFFTAAAMLLPRRRPAR